MSGGGTTTGTGVLGAFILAAACSGALARTDAKCLVSFARDDGTWSQPRRVDVEFYAARELFPEDRENPIYAKIWFNPEDPATVALDGTSLVVPSFYPSSLQKLFRDGVPHFGTEVDEPQRWRLQAVINGRWIDNRYPAAFDPPQSSYPADLGLVRRSFVRGASRICVYDRAGSPYVVTVDASAWCP